jgi:hypothetical protein
VDVSEYALEKVSFIPRRNARITANKDKTHLFVSLHGLSVTERMLVLLGLVSLDADRVPISLDNIAIDIDDGGEVSWQCCLASLLCKLYIRLLFVEILRRLLLALDNSRDLRSDRVGPQVGTGLRQRRHGVLLSSRRRSRADCIRMLNRGTWCW